MKLNSATALRTRSKALFDAGRIDAVTLVKSLQRAKALERDAGEDWTADEDKLLRGLVGQGVAFEDIAKRYSNRTRHACLGRSFRLGLTHPDAA